MKTSPISLLGVPLNLGAQNLAIADGPAAFRQHDIVAKLASTGLTIHDTGDIPCPDRTTLTVGDPQLRYLEPIVAIAEDSAARTHKLISEGHRVIALGGDHSLALGPFSGAASAVSGTLGLIYFDAHGDMNTAATTPTGNIHGMQLAALMGFGAPEMVNVHRPGAKLATSNLLHIGGCDFDQAELDLVAREHLDTYSILDVLTQGLQPLLAKIDALAGRVDHLWISLDLDAIDSAAAPAAGMPNQGGLTYREIAALATYIGTHCPVIGVDVVEYNPHQDINHKTAELTTELLAKFFGHTYSWYTDYLARDQASKQPTKA